MQMLRAAFVRLCLLGLAVLVSGGSGAALAEDRLNPPRYLASITGDEENEQIRFPIEVFSDPASDELYVIDSKDRAVVYTADLFPIFTIGRKQGVQGIQSLTMDREGYVYIAVGPTKDSKKRVIAVLSPRLKLEREIVLSGFKGADTFQPYRMAIDSRGVMYVAGLYQPLVVILDPKTGQVRNTLLVEEGGKEIKVNDVAVDTEDNVYVVSEEDSHIFVYDRDQKFLFRFGDKGGSSGKLSRPMAIGIDEKRGLLYVSDFMRHTILVYAKKDGKFISEFGGLGWGDGWFQHQRDLIVDRKGRIIIADTFNNRVQIMEYNDDGVR
ncbi:MAG: hypothetical protein OHK006_15320 [Thermodesulfovibrionales bacterium]